MLGSETPWVPEGPGGWEEGSNWRLPFVEPSEPAVYIFQVVIASENLPDNKAIHAKTVREYLKIRDIIQSQGPLSLKSPSPVEVQMINRIMLAYVFI